MQAGWQKMRMSKKAVRTMVLCAMTLGLLLPPLAKVSTAKQPEFVTIAEAYTSASPSQGIEVGSRIFSAPDLEEICSGVARPAKLVIQNGQNELLVLRVGDWFALDRLVIVAVDADGRALPPLPITLEAEEPEPPALDLRSDMIAEARVLPVRAGSFRLRARTLCSNPAVAAIVQATASNFNGGRSNEIVNDMFYYVANAQFGSFNKDGSLFPMERLFEPVILKAPLNEETKTSSRNISQSALKLETVATGLEIPWLIDFTPDDYLFFAVGTLNGTVYAHQLKR